MKIIPLFIFIVFGNLFLVAQSRFVPGLKLGMSTSQVHGDSASGFHKAGIAGGATLTTHFNKKWTAQFEIIFIQKGSKQVFSSAVSDSWYYYFLSLNYVEVPVLVQYHYKKFTIEAGPAFAYLINEKEWFNEQDLTGVHPFKSTEISGSAGISYLLLKRLGISCRYTNSLISIRDLVGGTGKWDTEGLRNNVLAFTFTYQFIPDDSK